MSALLAALPAALLQATPPAVPLQPAPLWRLMLDAALFGLAGIVLLIIGYYLWELITPCGGRSTRTATSRSPSWSRRSFSGWR